MMIAVFRGDHTHQELQLALNLKSRANFEGHYLKPAIEAGYVLSGGRKRGARCCRRSAQ